MGRPEATAMARRAAGWKKARAAVPGTDLLAARWCTSGRPGEPGGDMQLPSRRYCAAVPEQSNMAETKPRQITSETWRTWPAAIIKNKHSHAVHANHFRDKSQPWHDKKNTAMAYMACWQYLAQINIVIHT